MLAANIGVFVLENRNVQISVKLEGALFWCFGAMMVFFAVLRPFGIARDDQGYLDIYNTVCSTLDCGQWVQGNRDWGWYSLVGILKSIWPEPRTMLLIAGLALAMKLWVVFRLCSRPMVALLLFTGVFYQTQDLTAFRVSLSLAFFMFAIWIYLKQSRLFGGVALACPGFFHKQALLALGLIVAPLFRKRFWLLVLAMVTPFVMLWVFGKPSMPTFLMKPEDALSVQAVQQGLDAYISGYAAGAFQQDKLIPWSLYPLAGLGLWLAKDVFIHNRDLYNIVAASMAIGCGLLYCFSALTVAQVRFFEFFMLPMVLLAGEVKRTWLTLVLVVAVSGAYVIRFNVLHPLII